MCKLYSTRARKQHLVSPNEPMNVPLWAPHTRTAQSLEHVISTPLLSTSCTAAYVRMPAQPQLDHWNAIVQCQTLGSINKNVKL